MKNEKPTTPQLADEEDKPPQISQLLNKLREFYDDYITGPISKQDTQKLVVSLKNWLEHYGNKIKGGKIDIKFNLKPPKIREVCGDFHLKYQNNWRIFPQKWQLLLEVMGANQVHPVLIISLIQSIIDFKSTMSTTQDYGIFVNMLKSIGGQGWWVISIDNISKYAAAFEVTTLPTAEDKKLVCNEIDRLIGQQLYPDAAVMIRTFNMDKEFNCKNIARMLSARDFIDEVIRFAADNAELARIAVMEMNANKHASKARELIRKFNFDPMDFEHIVKAQTFLAVRSLVKRLGWMIAEESVSSYGNLEKAVLVDVLVRDKLFSEAIGVAQRFNIRLPGKLANELRTTPGLKPISNMLLAVDDFAPTEVYLDNLDPKTYLTMGDFGFKEEDVQFVCKEGPLFDEMTTRLLNAKTVGVDAEFCSDLIGYQQSTIAILQLATTDLVVIIDFMAMENNDKLYEFCCKFFSDEKIEKIGHTFTSDIKCLRTTFKDRPMDFENVINIDQVYVEGNRKFGLAQIVKKVYDKEFSKYNQQSNWKKRPLRRSQIHYGALDAVATLNILLKVRKDGSPLAENIEAESYQASKMTPAEDAEKKNMVVQNEEKLEEYKKKNDFKFVVDGMLKKLAHNLRNIGLDAVFAEEKWRPTQVIQFAESEDRIILTRDRKLIDCKKDKPLIRILHTDPFMQLKQIIDLLGIQATKASLLSRCVKCNAKDLKMIGFIEAQKTLQWENQDDSLVKEFWQCNQCQQIYWEGGTFDRARKMFSRLINSGEALPLEEGDEEISEKSSPEARRQMEIKVAETDIVDDEAIEEVNDMIEEK